ncbi:hypothetical protein HPT27_09815 [Permianibacter sp. IMCC34836]|uniref:hypothetical protein n=1 Tax=Permianibacter fluminis TaxID=2738515 RepID=UPI0015573BFB|nr:hypothetical protein [Permianibacter fluminis]NQD37324.1 hypothetical protein [Permianibacter fluminis]
MNRYVLSLLGMIILMSYLLASPAFACSIEESPAKPEREVSTTALEQMAFWVEKGYSLAKIKVSAESLDGNGQPDSYLVSIQYGWGPRLPQQLVVSSGSCLILLLSTGDEIFTVLSDVAESSAHIDAIWDISSDIDDSALQNALGSPGFTY